MKIFGFLLILQLFEDHYKSLFDKIDNYSIEVKQVGDLAEALVKRNNTNEFSFTDDEVRQSNFVTKRTMAKYYSKSLRDYINYRNISSDTEGFVVTLHTLNDMPTPKPSNSDKKNQTYPPTVIFIPNQGFDVTRIGKKTLSSTISVYIDKVLNNLDYNEIGALKYNITKNTLKIGNLTTLIIEPISKNETFILEKLSKRIINVEKFKEFKNYSTNNNSTTVNTLQYSENKSRITKVISEETKNETKFRIPYTDINDNIPKNLSKFNAKVMKMYKTSNTKSSQHFNKIFNNTHNEKLEINKQNKTYAFVEKQNEILNQDKGNISSFNKDKNDEYGVLSILNSIGTSIKSNHSISNVTTEEKTVDQSSYDEILKIYLSTSTVPSIQGNKVNIHDNRNESKKATITEGINIYENKEEKLKIYSTTSTMPPLYLNKIFGVMSESERKTTNNIFKIKQDNKNINPRINETTKIEQKIKEKTENIAPSLYASNTINSSILMSIPNTKILHKNVSEQYKFSISAYVTEKIMPNTTETRLLIDGTKVHPEVIAHSIDLTNSPSINHINNTTTTTESNIYDDKIIKTLTTPSERQSEKSNNTIESLSKLKWNTSSDYLTKKINKWPIYKDEVENITHMTLNKHFIKKTEKSNFSDSTIRQILINKESAFIAPKKIKVTSEVEKSKCHRNNEKNINLYDNKQIQTENFEALKDEKKVNVHCLKIIKLHINNSKLEELNSGKPPEFNNEKMIEKNYNISKIVKEQLQKPEIHNGKILKLYRKINKALPFITQKRQNYGIKTELNFKQNTDISEDVYKNWDYSLEEDSEEHPKFNLYTGKIQ